MQMDTHLDSRRVFDLKRALAYAAILFIVVGSFVGPGIGWLLGVVLMWMSNEWTHRDKVIVTLLTPGGVGLALFALAADLAGSSSPTTSTSPGALNYILAVFLCGALIGSVWSAGRLIRALR